MLYFSDLWTRKHTSKHVISDFLIHLGNLCHIILDRICPLVVILVEVII